MPIIPAFCNSCGTAFPSGIFAENSTFTIANFQTGPCPSCKSMGTVPSGYYKVTDTLIEIFANKGLSTHRLKQVLSAVNSAKREISNPEDQAKAIKEDIPELSSLFDVLPKTRNELYALLNLIATVIMAYISYCALLKDEPVKKEDIQQMIDKAIDQKMSKPKPYIAPNRQERNEKCNCGSGKKFKKCCSA